MPPQHHPGIIYEPRAFWEVFNATSASGTGGSVSPSTTLLSNDAYWYNGSKYPVEIRNIALSPISYTAESTGIRLGSANISQVKVGLFSKYRRNFVRALPLVFSDMAANTSEPPPAFPVPGVSTTRFKAWSTVYQEYEYPVSLPRDGAVEIQLTNPIILPNVSPLNIPVWISFAEYLDSAEGFGSGASRVFNTTVGEPVGAPAPYLFWGGITGAGAGNSIGAMAASPLPFAPNMLFTASEFKQQSPARAGSARVRGCSVMLDSIAFDTAVAGIPAVRPAHMATLVGSRMRSIDGGSGEFFWREGAPLALTFTTITPAVVYRLSEPFILGPGDQLQLEVEIPGSYYNGSTYEPTRNTFGVAANGYAIIEG